MGQIKLTRIQVENQRVDYWFSVTDDLKQFFAPQLHMFAQYDRCIEQIPESILVIPFLGNVMQVAWLTDSNVIVNTVDMVFQKSLGALREAYQKMYPNCPMKGSLCAKAEYNHHEVTCKSEKSAQMFTGGMDAVTTFIRHSDEHPLLILEYGFYSDVSDGSYAEDEKSERNFVSDCAATSKFADLHDTKATFIRANYGTFVNGIALSRRFQNLMGDDFWHGIHHAMAILSAAAPIAYLENVTRLYIASSFSVGNTYPCASDPTTDNEFKFADTAVCHDGYEMTDQDKARLVVNYQAQSGKPLALRVCSWNDHNCCSCEKCLRRMLQLSAEGGDPKNFGFSYNGSLLDVTQLYLKNEVQFFTAKNIDKWQRIITRMGDNYEGIYDKSVYEYLKKFDFVKEKRRGLWRYYYKNFFSIVKRKINTVVRRGD